MNEAMTFHAERNDYKAIFGSIAFMVIMAGFLIAQLTAQYGRFRQNTFCDSPPHRRLSIKFVTVSLSVIGVIFARFVIQAFSVFGTIFNHVIMIFLISIALIGFIIFPHISSLLSAVILIVYAIFNFQYLAMGLAIFPFRFKALSVGFINNYVWRFYHE